MSKTMLVLGAHRKQKGGCFPEAKTPQADDGQTRTVSPSVPMENTFLDKGLSNCYCSSQVEARGVADSYKNYVRLVLGRC